MVGSELESVEKPEVTRVVLTVSYTSVEVTLKAVELAPSLVSVAPVLVIVRSEEFETAAPLEFVPEPPMRST